MRRISESSVSAHEISLFPQLSWEFRVIRIATRAGQRPLPPSLTTRRRISAAAAVSRQRVPHRTPQGCRFRSVLQGTPAGLFASLVRIRKVGLCWATATVFLIMNRQSAFPSTGRGRIGCYKNNWQLSILLYTVTNVSPACECVFSFFVFFF